MWLVDFFLQFECGVVDQGGSDGLVEFSGFWFLLVLFFRFLDFREEGFCLDFFVFFLVSFWYYFRYIIGV